MEIILEGIRKSFGATAVLHGIDATIRSGESIYLIGPSGCGKTTLLRIIAGLEKPDSGSVRFDGRDVVNVGPGERELGFVFQQYALWPHMTAMENVMFALECRKVPKSEARPRATEMLERVRLSEMVNRYPRELSGGQQQRVALARAIVTYPRVVLFDEPFANLDAHLRTMLRKEFGEILSSVQSTAVFVTHDRGEALAFADRIAVICDGVIAQFDTPANIFGAPNSRFVCEYFDRGVAFRGRVAGVGGTEISVEIRPGERLTARPINGSFSIGDSVHGVLRSSGIRIDPSGTLTAVVKERLFQGGTFNCELEIQDIGSVFVDLPADTVQLVPGAVTRIALAPESVFAFHE